MSTDINIKKKISIEEEGALLTTDVNNINFVGPGVTASTLGNDVTVTVAGSIGGTVYYMNETVTQAPYKEFSSNPTSAVEQVIPATVAGGATATIAAYQTPVGVPNTTVIPAGLWQLFLHFNAGSAGQNWIIRPYVYKRDLGGIETLIFTPDPQIVTGMSTTTTMYTCDGVFPNTTLLTTDRIVVKIDVENTSGVSQTVNFRTEGSQHYSVTATTLNQAISAGSVTSVSGTAPIVSSGGSTPAISIPQATALVDGYLSSSDWSVFNAKVPATRNLTINGTTYDLSADRTWTVSAASGVFGISDSSGVYTYYATLTLAMAAATSGQTIEMFADVTETGNVSISLKDNVNINGNGHTYTVTNTSASLIIFNNTLGSRTIVNLTVFGNGVDSSCTGFRTSTGNTTCSGFLIKMTSGTGCATFGGGIIDGITCRVTGTSVGIFLNGGYILNSRSYSVSGRAINCSVGNGNLYNCHGESTNSVGIYGGYMRKCVGISSADSGICLQGGGGAIDCIGISSSSYGILITGSSGLHSNLVAISSGLWALRVFAGGIKINGFSAYSTASYGLVSGFDAILTNGYVESTTAAAFASDGGTYNNVYAKCSWNNAGGHALNVSGNGIQLINCTFDVTNASANCINASSAYSTKYMRSTFKGATTPVNANITQGQINTEDNQGNILI
jgi:hypothetical protein